MEFTPMDAAQYRALSREDFVARRNKILELLNAESLPEDIDFDNLMAEADIIEAEVNRRNSVEAAKQRVSATLSDPVVVKRNDAAKAVLFGEGNVIASTETRQERGFQAVSEQPFTNTREYRAALAKHIMRQAPMPAEMIAKAYQERANTPVSMNDGFTNMADPTFQNTISSLIMVPMELTEEVQKEMREISVLYDKINITNMQGGIAVSEYDLRINGSWIGDKEVSPYQTDTDAEIFTWAWHQFEARFARSFLAQALMTDTYTSQLAPALAECYANAMDLAIYAGTGVGQPRGITNDLRLLGSDGLGLDSTLPNFYTQRTGAGKGRALVIEVTDDQIDDWKWWKTILMNEKFNRLYRNTGDLMLADATWNNHVEVLHDDNNRPITLARPLVDGEQLAIRGIGNVTLLPNTVIKPYDSASVGDIVGVYGNLKNYTMNVQPGMPLSTVSWEDHETNTHKTKILTAMDGRVSNPFGWLFIKKGASA